MTQLRAIAALCLLATAFTSTARADGSTLPEKVTAFFEAPARTFRRDRVPGAHRIIVLSNLAQYCAAADAAGLLSSRVARTCLEDAVDIALRETIRPYQRSVAVADLGDHGLYLSHLNIVLGLDARVSESKRHRGLHHRVSQHLARLSVREEHCHAPSFPNSDLRFPADQAATLYSLHLYDEAAGTALAVEPTACWLEQMRAHRTRWDLPVSELSGKTRTSHLPRGCALSWTVRYLAAFDPVAARALWRRYRNVFLVDVGFAAGFREWPPGIHHREDVDSGPVVLGAGAAATGLGLAAAAAIGDRDTYEQLKSAEALVRALGGARLQKVGNSILSVSIELSAAAAMTRRSGSRPATAPAVDTAP